MLPRVSPAKGKARFRLKRESRQLCRDHFMENQFGLWPYRCSRQCSRARAKASEIKLKPEDLLVWIQLEVILGKGNHPNCPWCGKPLKSTYVKPKGAK
jgi:hypothetical protein